MSVDKNTATLDFLATYPDIQGNRLFFNFINAHDNDIQFISSSNEKVLDKPYVDGSVKKQYNFSLVITKTMSSQAIAKDAELGLMSENLDDIADIQAVMDWVNEQGEARNFPDFGDKCIIDAMHTSAENPNLDGINTEAKPALALYSMEIRIDYIDYTKVIWS